MEVLGDSIYNGGVVAYLKTGEEIMKCPKCPDRELVSVLSEEGFPLDYCIACFGIWFDKGEVAQHFDLEADVPNLKGALETARKTGLSCPRCSAELEEFQFDATSNLLLDRCSGCEGIWFDFHETEKLVKWATTSEDPRARLARAVQRLKDKDFKMI